MIISKKGKKYSFIDYFKTHEDLKSFIKTENEFINVEFLNNKIKGIYNDLSYSNNTVRYNLLGWYIVGQLKFKHKSAFRLQFWEERGYTINEYITWLKRRRNNVNLTSLSNDNQNKFKYGVFKFKLYGNPICRICNSELNIDLMGDTYHIINCKNNNCQSNLHKEIDTIRQLAFLPNDIFSKKNKRINPQYKNIKEYWILNGFTLEETTVKINEIKNKLRKIPMNSSEYYQILTGIDEIEAKERTELNSQFSVSYWIKKGYTEEESVQKIKELQRNNSKLLMIKKKENPELYKGINSNQIEYWIKKGYTIKESKKLVKERQSTFTLSKCIERYGIVDGTKRYTERQNKWVDSISRNGNIKNGYSKISQDLFWRILENYNIDEKNNVFFATKNSEFKINKESGGICLYDFADIKGKKIIEFNGDIFHGNPKKYKSTDFPNPFKKTTSAGEIWEKDKIKLNIAKINGYKTLIIWETDYRYGNKEKIIKKCLNFLNKQNEEHEKIY